MDGRVISDILPEGSYLATRYYDGKRQLETRRVYYEDGRVEAFDGNEWWSVCRFSGEQIAQAKAAVQASGLLSAEDLNADGVYDSAAYTYAWRFDEQQGMVTNWAYPAQTIPAFETLTEQLDALEMDAMG
jgi:hypothetical protein